ncbi:arylamine N-acetyltransferase family protein [Actinoplanes sp. CA-131856]
MDVDAYLDRIGVRRSATLREMHRAHQETVPFENLGIHLDEPISLAPDDLFDKIVRRRRGGFCYELNGAFAIVLEALGYSVVRAAARVYRTPELLGPPFDHLALLVHTADGDGPWLADVGFGRHSTSPGSHFTHGPVCSRLDGDGRVSISGRTLIRTNGETRSETPLESDEALLAAYRDHFGIVLDRAPGNGIRR